MVKDTDGAMRIAPVCSNICLTNRYSYFCWGGDADHLRLTRLCNGGYSVLYRSEDSGAVDARSLCLGTRATGITSDGERISDEGGDTQAASGDL